MEIVIEGEAAAIVERLVRTGRFATAREAVEDALRLADLEAGKLAWMRAKVQEALDAGDDGTLEDLDREMEALFLQLDRDRA